MKYYAILNKEEIHDTTEYDNTEDYLSNYWCIDFSKLTQVNLNSLYYNNDGTKAVVSYIGEKPSFLNGKTIYSNSEIIEEMKKSEWVRILP
tara:strand:- start:1061 stop:1333 length:273 start_codon:yes stop_codon:yes gene_type:complete